MIVYKQVVYQNQFKHLIELNPRSTLVQSDTFKIVFSNKFS